MNGRGSVGGVSDYSVNGRGSVGGVSQTILRMVGGR